MQYATFSKDNWWDRECPVCEEVGGGLEEWKLVPGHQQPKPLHTNAREWKHKHKFIHHKARGTARWNGSADPWEASRQWCDGWAWGSQNPSVDDEWVSKDDRNQEDQTVSFWQPFAMLPLLINVIQWIDERTGTNGKGRWRSRTVRKALHPWDHMCRKDGSGAWCSMLPGHLQAIQQGQSWLVGERRLHLLMGKKWERWNIFGGAIGGQGGKRGRRRRRGNKDGRKRSACVKNSMQLRTQLQLQRSPGLAEAWVVWILHSAGNASPLVHPAAIWQKASRRLLAWTSTDAWLGWCDDKPISCAISSCKPPCHKCGEADRGMTRCKHSDSYHSPPTLGNTDCRCDRRCCQKDSEHPPVSLGGTKVQSWQKVSP